MPRTPTFDGNEVLGVSSLSSPGATGGSAVGGAVANYGVMNLANCSFTNNSAFGGAGGPDPSPGYAYGCPGGTGSGGAVWNSGLLTGSGSSLQATPPPVDRRSRRMGMLVACQRPLRVTLKLPGGDGSGAALFNYGVARW